MTEKTAVNKSEQNFLKAYCSLHHLTGLQKITGGWSADKKYLVQNSDGEKFLLRITMSAEKLPYKQQEFAALKTLEKLDLPIPQPLDLAAAKDGETICMLLSWVPGKELTEAMPDRSPQDQYRLGLAAGKILRQLHTVPAPDTIPHGKNGSRKKSIAASKHMPRAASGSRTTRKFLPTLLPTAI